MIHPVLGRFFWEVVAGLVAPFRSGSRGDYAPFAKAQISKASPNILFMLRGQVIHVRRSLDKPR